MEDHQEDGPVSVPGEHHRDDRPEPDPGLRCCAGHFREDHVSLPSRFPNSAYTVSLSHQPPGDVRGALESGDPLVHRVEPHKNAQQSPENTDSPFVEMKTEMG